MDVLIWTLLIAILITVFVWIASKARGLRQGTKTYELKPILSQHHKVSVASSEHLPEKQQDDLLTTTTYSKVTDEGEKIIPIENKQLAIKDDAVALQMLDMLEQFRKTTHKRYQERIQEFQDRSQQRNAERNELQRKYETKFDDWNRFEEDVKKRLYETMSKPDLAQKTAELMESDSLESFYYFAAEDIHFNREISQMPGVETAELDAHEQWINFLLQKEFEQKINGNTSNIQASNTVETQVSKDGQAKEIIEALEGIAKLRDNGIISNNEFEMKKAELLKRL